MHIAFNGWFWDQPHVGSGQYLRRLIGQLRRIAPELEMTLILPPHIQSPDAVPENVQVMTSGGFGGRLGKVWFEQRSYPRLVKRSGADIAHVPYWGPPLASSARLVTTILDVAPLIIPDYTSTLWTRLYSALVTTAATGAAHTITISETAKADIRRYIGILEDEISVTYLGADDRFHPQMGAEHDEAIREKYNLPDRFVLYLGGFDVRKQINLLLLAYTYVIESEGNEVPLVLAGKEPAWGTSVFPDMRAYAEELNLEDVLIWPGYIDEADKPALYRLAEVFVSPVMYEGFGLPVVEAMASGTPVVANEIDVYEETLGDGAFLTASARAMAGAIIALLLQEPLRESMINQGRAQATRYNWRKTAQATLEVYEKVMGL
jgi:glycosyltransferase involved in cell wall biosynthesis